jgi:hypothetical protein
MTRQSCAYKDYKMQLIINNISWYAYGSCGGGKDWVTMHVSETQNHVDLN